MARQLIVGNQGRTHQAGAYQGSFRGRERIAYQDLPSIYEIEQTLEQLTASITLRTEDIPRRPITLPPIVNELSEIDVYTEMARLDLQYDDLKTDKPRTASLTRLCKALLDGISVHDSVMRFLIKLSLSLCARIFNRALP